MPIKFGDLIENANSAYAVIDLTDNQSRGVAFIEAFGTLTDGVSTALTSVPADKRRQGMLLVDKETAEVFILEGADSDDDNTYTDVEFGTAPGQEDSKWKAVGSLELQTEDIAVNIDESYANNGSGTSPNVGKTFGKYHPGFSQTVGDQGTQIGKIPVEAWIAEKTANADYGVIASAQGATSLEIIRDALNELFTLQPTLAATGVIEFNQPSGNVALSASCNNLNETTCTSFKFYAREIGSSTWGSPVSTVTAGSGFTDPTTNTWTASHNFSWDGQDNQYQNFEGFEFKVEVLDGVGSTGSAEDSVERSNYVVPQISNWSVTRQKNNTLYNGTDAGSSDNDFNETDEFRVLGNIDSDIDFTITPSISNHESITDGSHTWTLIRKSIGEGSVSNWVQIASGSFVLGNATFYNVSTSDTGAASLSLKTNKLQYAVVVDDVFTTNLSYSLNNHLSDKSGLDYWGQEDYQIINQSAQGVISSFSGNPSGTQYAGNVSPQIRFVPPWFTGYIPEATFGEGFGTLSQLTSAHMNVIIAYQFNTSGDDAWVDVEAHEESPLLLRGTELPPFGNGQASGAYQVGSWAVDSNSRFYLIGVKIKNDISGTSGYASNSSTNSFVDYSSTIYSSDLGLSIGASYIGAEIYIGSSSQNQNTAFKANISVENISIVGRTDASGNAIANRTITDMTYSFVVGDQVGSVSGALKIAK